MKKFDAPLISIAELQPVEFENPKIELFVDIALIETFAYVFVPYSEPLSKEKTICPFTVPAINNAEMSERSLSFMLWRIGLVFGRNPAVGPEMRGEVLSGL